MIKIEFLYLEDFYKVEDWGSKVRRGKKKIHGEQSISFSVCGLSLYWENSTSGLPAVKFLVHLYHRAHLIFSLLRQGCEWMMDEL